jgi:hypothetical protein
MRIYISGPITNVLDFKEKFDQAEKHLKQTYPNAEIINPTMIVLPKSCTHEGYMKIDFMLLDLCDAVYLLDGWEWSKGANQEYGYAVAKDLIILKEEN